MPFGVECEGCGDFVPVPDGDSTAPHISVRDIFMEDGDPHQRDRQDVYLCPECKAGAFDRAIEAARTPP